MGLAVKIIGLFTGIAAISLIARKGSKIVTSKYLWSTVSMVG